MQVIEALYRLILMVCPIKSSQAINIYRNFRLPKKNGKKIIQKELLLFVYNCTYMLNFGKEFSRASR